MVKRDKPKIAILGARGRLGREAAHAFHAAGWRVRAVTRGGDWGQEFGYDTAAGDMMNKDDAVRATDGCAFIFNGLNPKYTDWQRQVMPMAQNVVAAAKENGAVHLFPGNIYNFGSQLPEIIDVSTPQKPDHPKAAIRVEAEQFFSQAASNMNVQTIILRAGDFFGGAGTGSWFDLVIAASIAKGKVVYPGPKNIAHEWAYLPDLARCFVQLAEHSGELSSFECFHFAGHNITGEQLHAALEQAMGTPLRAGTMPWPLIRLGGLVYPMWREVWEVSYLWRQPHRLVDERLGQIIGPTEITPLRSAVANALNEIGIEPKAAATASRMLPTMAS